MKTAKEIAIQGVFVALLIGGQFIFSAIVGIEIVTILITSFCFYFGVLRGITVATAFSLLRCFIFGFFPQIIVLYLCYYNFIAILFGFMGKAFLRKVNVKKLIVITIVAVLSTVLFTIFDLLLQKLFYGFTIKAITAYFIAGIPTLITQIICVFISVLLLFNPLLKVYKSIRI